MMEKKEEEGVGVEEKEQGEKNMPLSAWHYGMTKFEVRWTGVLALPTKSLYTSYLRFSESVSSSMKLE